MIEQLRKQLMRHEGFRSHAYQDTEGYWTIGYGRLIDQRLGGGITEQEAAVLLDADIARARQEAMNAWPWLVNVDSARQDVVVNMAFNMGVPRLKGFRKFLAALQAGDFSRAADEMLDSRWARQVGLRSAELSQQMRSGRYK
jgi:lysozyme